jgi:hypothetical protein
MKTSHKTCSASVSDLAAKSRAGKTTQKTTKSTCKKEKVIISAVNPAMQTVP